MVVAHVGKAELERVMHNVPGSWSAYELSLRGDHAQRLPEQTWDPQFLYEARSCFDEALKADPDNAKICSKLAHTYVRAYADPGSPDLGSKELEGGSELSRRAVGLDPNLPLARAARLDLFLDGPARCRDLASGLNDSFDTMPSQPSKQACSNTSGPPAVRIQH